ncbi:MAG TPA: S41 family peptidase [Candidatus Tumulicola sp.]|nr:S41 family peptidase [Candidatus Tumulicola sp.]
MVLPISAIGAQGTRSDRWRAVARADLDAVHRTIVEAHPGAIDAENPSFRTWMEDGYRQALALLPHVTDYSTALDAVRWYVTGFRDGHLLLSDDTRPSDELIPSKGWGVAMRHGHFVVTNVASHWQAALPPPGATVLSCDGRSPQAIATEDVAPYIDRRDLPLSRQIVAEYIGEPSLSMRKRLKSCTFAPSDGRAAMALDVVYRPLVFEQWASIMNDYRRPRARVNDYDLTDGLLWIRAQTFSLDHEQYAVLESMLQELRRLHGVRAIVFDVRGNGGGNSEFGGEIFDAATGGLRYDHRGLTRLPAIYAEWRVSAISIEAAKTGLANALRVSGPGSSTVEWYRDHLRSLLVAQAAGKPWARQDTGERRLTRKEMKRRQARLRRFAGPIAVLTDEYCASACLDFVDLVRQVPGALQLGATTGADSVYIDTGRVRLPSGNHLVLPLKVWRNRLRSNNEAMVPDITYDGDLDDDAAVRIWVVSVLAGRGSRNAFQAATHHAAVIARP